MEAWIGTILPVAFNYAPEGWLMANGQLLPINQQQAVFSVLSTIYGGDGVRTFGLPDLRGRVPLGFGTSTGGGNYPVGLSAGTETLTLSASHLPAHTHTATFTPRKSDLPVTIPAQTGDLAIAGKLQASVAGGLRQAPLANDMLGASSSSIAKFYTNVSTTPVDLTGVSLTVTGKAGTAAVSATISGVVTDGTVTVAPSGVAAPSPLDNRMPFLAINFIVCLSGIYPSKP